MKREQDGKDVKKARLVIMGHMDPDKPLVVNEAPTVWKSSIRLFLTFSRAYQFSLWTRDVKQAYVQSKDKLQRELYMIPPKSTDIKSILVLEEEVALKALKPLYGLSESPSYWWHAFGQCHVENLGLKQSVMDPSLFF